MKTYIYHSDAGHGWLAVKQKELAELGILEKVSVFSYHNGQTVYLEEDVDAGLFVQAYLSKHGKKPAIRESYQENSTIRSYARFVIEIIKMQNLNMKTALEEHEKVRQQTQDAMERLSTLLRVKFRETRGNAARGMRFDDHKKRLSDINEMIRRLENGEV